MSGFAPGLLLGLLLGLVAGGAACWGLARVLMRVAGLADARSLARFLLEGLRRHGRHDPVEVERTLSRALKDQYSVLASGTRLAAGAVVLRVSPEDHAVLEQGLGVAAAAADLADFYRRHATASGWQVLTDPVVTIERDISLKPREAVAQRTVRPGEPAEQGEPEAVPRAAPGRPAPAAAVPLPDWAERSAPVDPLREVRSGPIPLPLHEPPVEGGTTPLPLGGFADGGTEITEVLRAASVDDVVVRNGRSVVTVPASAQRATIGRAAGSAVRVQAHGVAEEHALLERRGADWYLVPRAPAVYVGGERVDEPVRLVGTNIVGLGRVARLEVTVP
jgi:hypothetical protein